MEGRATERERATVRRGGREETEDEDGGRWSGGKVRVMTEAKIEQEGRGNSILLYSMTVEGKPRTGSCWGISFVSAPKS